MVASRIDLDVSDFKMIDKYVADIRRVNAVPGQLFYESRLFQICQQHQVRRRGWFLGEQFNHRIDLNDAWLDFTDKKPELVAPYGNPFLSLAEAFAEIYPLCRPTLDDEAILQTRDHEFVHSFFGNYWPQTPGWMITASMQNNAMRDRNETLLHYANIKLKLAANPNSVGEIISMHPELEQILHRHAA